MLRGFIGTTLLDTLFGFILAVVIGAVLAVLLASSRLASQVMAPYLSAINGIPKIALAPLFVLVFGTGSSGKVYFIALSVFFIPFYSLFRALTAVDPTYVNHARVLGASRLSLAKDVYLPAVVGSLVAVLRVTVSFSLISAIIFELIASQGGIGYQLNLDESNVQPAQLVAGVLIVAIIAFIVDRIFVATERHYAGWRLDR
jgi:NitT/TauT family transport system permease protein